MNAAGLVCLVKKKVSQVKSNCFDSLIDAPAWVCLHLGWNCETLPQHVCRNQPEATAIKILILIILETRITEQGTGVNTFPYYRDFIFEIKFCAKGNTLFVLLYLVWSKIQSKHAGFPSQSSMSLLDLYVKAMLCCIFTWVPHIYVNISSCYSVFIIMR